MNAQIIEAGDYHVTCVGYPMPDGTFRGIARFERGADWKRYVDGEASRLPMRAMAHRVDGRFDSEHAAVEAAVRYAGTAVSSGSVLWFDEADALFGKRTDVKDSHDR